MPSTFRDQLVVWLLIAIFAHIIAGCAVLVDQQWNHRTRYPWLRRGLAIQLLVGIAISAVLFCLAAVIAVPTKQYRVARTFDTVIVRTVTGRRAYHYVELVRGRDTVAYETPAFCDMGSRYVSYGRYFTDNMDSAQATVQRLLENPELAYTVKCPERVISISASVPVQTRK